MDGPTERERERDTETKTKTERERKRERGRERERKAPNTKLEINFSFSFRLAADGEHDQVHIMESTYKVKCSSPYRSFLLATPGQERGNRLPCFWLPNFHGLQHRSGRAASETRTRT